MSDLVFLYYDKRYTTVETFVQHALVHGQVRTDQSLLYFACDGSFPNFNLVDFQNFIQKYHNGPVLPPSVPGFPSDFFRTYDIAKARARWERISNDYLKGLLDDWLSEAEKVNKQWKKARVVELKKIIGI